MPARKFRGKLSSTGLWIDLKVVTVEPVSPAELFVDP